MISTNGWDTLLFCVSYHDGRLERRIGLWCLLLAVVTMWKAVRACTGKVNCCRIDQLPVE